MNEYKPADMQAHDRALTAANEMWRDVFLENASSDPEEYYKATHLAFEKARQAYTMRYMELTNCSQDEAERAAWWAADPANTSK